MVRKELRLARPELQTMRYTAAAHVAAPDSSMAHLNAGTCIVRAVTIFQYITG